jgi:hypothetical protein
VSHVARALITVGTVSVVTGIGVIVNPPISRWRYGVSGPTRWAERFARAGRPLVVLRVAALVIGVLVGLVAD